MAYSKFLGPQSTPQSHPARPDQVPNNAGGYAFKIDKWDQLERFLILGTESGTYYVNARDLTVQNLDAVKACIAEDGLRVVELVRKISHAGRAIKNDPAILVLAAVVSFGSIEAKRLVRESAINEVCRTGTHVLHFASYADKMRGWGRSLRTTIQAWYDTLCERSVDNLAYQMVKYQSRDGWAHRDLIRLAHPGSNDKQCAALYDWALHGVRPEKTYPKIVNSFEAAKTAIPAEIAQMIVRDGLSREMIPTDKLNSKEVAYQLAMHMPVGAMIRNLGNMAKAGLLEPGSETFTHTIQTLTDPLAVRVHPISILLALKTYASGRSVRGHGEWPVIPQVVDALNEAFYAAFEAVKPLNRRLLIAVDSSGSMTEEVTGTPGFSAVEAAAAMALVTASTEKLYTLLAFDTQVYAWNISPRSRLDDVMRHIPGGGGTDVSAPINYLIATKKAVDAVIVYTDNETWHGYNHPFEAMAKYRQSVNKNAKFVIVAACANSLTVGAPDDSLTLTVCGFDPTVPEVVRAFLAD